MTIIHAVAEVICWHRCSFPWQSVRVCLPSGHICPLADSHFIRFFNGGILFSSFILTFIALVSLYSFLLLVKTKFVVSGSFGDIGGVLYGPWMRFAILTSITISQLGFVSAYIIFVSENLSAFVKGITHCATALGIQWFILLQLVIFLPLALVRNLAKLSTTALVADAFILAGLIYIFGTEASIMGQRGHAHVELFNPTDWPLLIG